MIQQCGEHPYNIKLAQNGEEAIQLIMEEQPDFLFYRYPYAQGRRTGAVPAAVGDGDGYSDCCHLGLWGF